MAIEGLGNKIVYFDGAMGTQLQANGLVLGEVPECYNFTHQDLIKRIHASYLEAGCDLVTTNTFGANRYKIEATPYTVAEVIGQAVKLAKEAIQEAGRGMCALDIGSTGKLLKPLGDVAFEEAYDVFKEQVVAGVAAGCDCILFETFTDLYELKAGVLAAKEHSTLPILCTMSFEANGRTFFGTSIEAMVLTLEGLGVDALGVNCSLGPKELLPVVEKLMQYATIPVIVQPNAGLPKMVEGQAVYDMTSETFTRYMKHFVELGVSVLGGCCGTTPSYIGDMIACTKVMPYKGSTAAKQAGVCSATEVVFFDDVKVIGERLNPTGKKRLKEAIRQGDKDFILKEALAQKEEGAELLDVNMGLPDIDEVETLKEVVAMVQSVVALPLQIDSSNPEAIEQAVRIYNGKPLINSVNAKPESLAAILPIAKKYGAAVLGLTLDETGIPETAEERLCLAKQIVAACNAYGIPKEDVFIDALVLTASAQQTLVRETLKAVRLIKEQLGVKTVLGVSNVSFGLPKRPILNSTMLGMALMQGLDAPILNTGSQAMMQVVDAYRVIVGSDLHATDYIAKYADRDEEEKQAPSLILPMTLQEAVIKGLREAASQCAQTLLRTLKPLEVVEQHIIPALNEVGSRYEAQRLFLPQLIQSAEAAQAAFEVIKTVMGACEATEEAPKIVIATVQGDIHDIGKNIVKVIMQNYGFKVIDLGKDVPPHKVLEAVQKHQVKLVGLSALMTTTVASMKETIALLRQANFEGDVIVGGAVLTKDLAHYVNADYYAQDAMETVKISRKICGM